MIKRSTPFVALLLTLSIAPYRCFAADLTRKLTPGSSVGDVLGAWGEPAEKVEKDVKRQVVWYYPQGAKVVFKNGRVSSWRPPDSVVAQEQKERERQKLAATPVSEEVARETRDLVRDIAKEVPSGPDISVPDSNPSQPPPPPLVPNQIPPGGRGAPSGVVPGSDVLEEED